ncbi:MAG TPA: hypothetical protein VFX12_04125 [Vicinamibacterales bacterium]|nr:hypothetical protein [Vicinamibacterales bacterium]
MIRICAALSVSAFTIALGPVQRPSAAVQEVPPSLFLTATSSDVLTFAKAAVAHRIPVGAVISEHVRRARGRPAIRLADPRDADLDRVIERFDTAHQGYNAAFAGGELLIQDETVPFEITQLLAKHHAGVTFESTPSYAALLRVGDLLALRADGGGYIGSAPPDDCPTRVPITLHRPEPSTRELLDAIAQQARTGWLLFFDLSAPKDSLQLGYLCPDGSYTYFTVRGW